MPHYHQLLVPVILRSIIIPGVFFRHFYFPAQLVGGFTLSDLLDNPWSQDQVSSLLPRYARKKYSTSSTYSTGGRQGYTWYGTLSFSVLSFVLVHHFSARNILPGPKIEKYLRKQLLLYKDSMESYYWYTSRFLFSD